MLVRFTTTVAASRAATWAFVAEFANIGSWDPGVKAAKKARAHRVVPSPSRSRIRLVVTFARAADERGRNGRGLYVRPDNSIQGQRERDAVRCHWAPLARWALPPRALTRCRSYTVKHWDPPNKVVVTGDSSSVSAEDAIVFSDGATPGSTTIEYTVRGASSSVVPPRLRYPRAVPRRTSSLRAFCRCSPF